MFVHFRHEKNYKISMNKNSVIIFISTHEALEFLWNEQKGA